MNNTTDYLKAIRKKLGRYRYNEVKYLIGLFGLECYFAHQNPEYKGTLDQAKNLRHAFIEGCNAQQEADKNNGVV